VQVCTTNGEPAGRRDPIVTPIGLVPGPRAANPMIAANRCVASPMQPVYPPKGRPSRQLVRNCGRPEQGRSL
jgi:hypothetical protein